MTLRPTAPLAILVVLVLLAPAAATASDTGQIAYRLLATTKTSTLQSELAEAADAGYRLAHMMGGETAFGGDEVVAVMTRGDGAGTDVRYEYELLATNKTSTMQKEMSEAAERGYVYRAQSVSKTTFGGREVLVIMEREQGAGEPRAEYLLLATMKTSTMQKELSEAGEDGWAIVGLTVAKTLFGGEEAVAILERPLR